MRGKTGVSPTDPKDFVGVWNVMLRKVKMEGQAPRAAILDITSESVAKTAGLLESSPLTTIHFLDNEFAELTFANGEKGKCYFVVNEFSKVKPCYIDFKGQKQISDYTL